MYAEVSEQHINTHAMLLDIGNVYTLSRFQVKNARATYMPFEANLMIEIGAYTLINPVTNPPTTFPEIVYRLTKFSDLKPLQGSTKTYIGKDHPHIYIPHVISHITTNSISYFIYKQMSLAIFQKFHPQQPDYGKMEKQLPLLERLLSKISSMLSTYHYIVTYLFNSPIQIHKCSYTYLYHK